MSKCCKTLEELQSCLQSGDFSAIPTAQTNLRNFELPISKDDADFLSGEDAYGEADGIDFYLNPTDSMPQRDANGNLSMSVAQSLIRSGLRFRTDFVLDAIAVIAHVEPYAWMLNGNRWNLGQDAFDGSLFANTDSPLYPNGGAEVIGGVPTVSSAQLEWGSPTWRAAYYFMQTYRLAMLCPDAANAYELMNERLVDLGNCHMGTTFNGFGESGASEIYGVRRVNKRLKWMTDHNQVPQIPFTKDGTPFAKDADLGYFLPFNEDQEVRVTRSGCRCNGDPTRMMNASSAYGSAEASPYMCQWYRLPVPRVISHDDNLEILLKRDISDSAFYQRMLQEMAYHDGMSPIPDVSGLTTKVQLSTGIGWTDGDQCPYQMDTTMYRIPGGQMRLGLALKGHLIDRSLCCQIKNGFNAMSSVEAKAAGFYHADRIKQSNTLPTDDSLPIIY